MLKKNGFTMAETIVSIAIIVMISLVILTTSAVCSKSFLKSKCLNFGITQIDNVCKIYEKTNVVLAGEISYDTLKTNLNTFYGQNIEYTQTSQNDLIFELVFDKNYKIEEKGIIKVNIVFLNLNGFLTLCGKVFMEDNSIYENNVVFKKVVSA